MEKKPKKRLGRPRKIEGVISYREFARAGIVMSLYDGARKSGLKHSSAVVQAVELMEERYAKKRISQTGVKRVLAEFRPRIGKTILQFERSTLTGEDLARFYWIQEQLAALPKRKWLKLPTPSEVIPPKTVAVYKIRFVERPNYPRHNRKPPKE